VKSDEASHSGGKNPHFSRSDPLPSTRPVSTDKGVDRPR
jgi:hypothetical protein